jgi:16S rRNA (guanine527-N7)-methyltransferase
VSLLTALERARDLGFLGPGPVAPHIAHASQLVAPIEARFGPDAAFDALDLGSGGGLPGLVVALAFPRSRWCLLDANLRRTQFLAEAVGELGLGERVVVERGRAEVVAADDARRERYQLVTARSFGPPAVTAECAVPFLAPEGYLMVSEPPDSDHDRWPADGLAGLGLRVDAAGPWAILQRQGPLPGHLPRREGQAAKRPAW